MKDKFKHLTFEELYKLLQSEKVFLLKTQNSDKYMYKYNKKKNILLVGNTEEPLFTWRISRLRFNSLLEIGIWEPPTIIEMIEDIMLNYKVTKILSIAGISDHGITFVGELGSDSLIIHQGSVRIVPDREAKTTYFYPPEFLVKLLEIHSGNGDTFKDILNK